MSLDADTRAPFGRRLLGSALSAFVGWLTVNIFILIFGIIATRGISAPGPSAHERWAGTAIVGLVSFVFIFGTWFVALIPLYLLVPLNSWLWRWYVCTACGAISGLMVIYVVNQLTTPQAHWGFAGLLGAIAGGVTCLFGSLTVRCFQLRSGATSAEPDASVG